MPLSLFPRLFCAGWSWEFNTSVFPFFTCRAFLLLLSLFSFSFGIFFIEHHAHFHECPRATLALSSCTVIADYKMDNSNNNNPFSSIFFVILQSNFPARPPFFRASTAFQKCALYHSTKAIIFGWMERAFCCLTHTFPYHFDETRLLYNETIIKGREERKRWLPFFVHISAR